ncbi:MAG: IS630 family transposase [Chloroflexota bacterium]|nr:IS630 family transposase [Chloroflexota bacterium]
MKKNAQAVTQFQAEFPALVQAAVPPDEARPVVVWAFDQSRFGLRTIQRRRITNCGVKPWGICQYGYQNFWLYGAVAPATGDAFFYVLPLLNAEYMQLFLNALAEARPDTLNVLLLDNSRAHTAHELVVPANIVLLFQPAYAPEVNPSERVWEHLKTDLAWERYASLQALQDHIVRLVESYDGPTLHSLTAYPYFMNAVNALSP